MPNRATEGQGSLPLVAAIVLQGILSPSFDNKCILERLWIPTAIAPGYVSIIDQVWHSEVVERHQQLAAHTLEQVAPVDQILAAEREEVPSIGSFGSRGETQ